MPQTNGFLAAHNTWGGRFATWFFVYSAVVLSFVRGLPVVYDSWDYLRGQAPEQRQARERWRQARERPASHSTLAVRAGGPTDRSCVCRISTPAL